MAKGSHTRAFVTGILLGGAVGAVYAVQHAQKSGRDLRAELRNGFEQVMFDLLGIDEAPLAGVPVVVQAPDIAEDRLLSEAPVAARMDLLISGQQGAAAQ